MHPDAHRLGRLTALAKFAAPLVTGASIAHEFAELARKYPNLAGRFPGRLGLSAAPVTSAPNAEAQMLDKLRGAMARPSGALEAGRAEALARSGQLGQGALLKVSDAIERDPLARYRRRRNIDEQWTNLPKTGAATTRPGKLPFGVPASNPLPKKPVPAAVGAAPRPSPPSSGDDLTPLRSFQPQVPLPPASPNVQVAAGILGANSGQAIANQQKMGEWRLRPRPKLPLGQIQADNGSRPLGTNFDLPRNGTTTEVSQAWNRMSVQRNSDPINLNALNEGVVPTVGT